MEGWISLHRQLCDSPLWTCEPFSRGQAWVDLLLLANHADSFFYKRGVKINVNRGQVGRSEVELSDRWKWSRNKVRKFIKDLENEQQIEQQKTNVTQLLTIVNYSKFQEKGQQTKQQKDSRRTAEGQQKDTYNNVNNENNENNVNKDLTLFTENEKAGKVKEFDYKTTLISKLKKEDFKTDSEKQYFEITKAFYDLIIETKKQLSISTAKIERSNGKWIDSIRLILTDDKHTLKDLQDVFKVVRDDAFWKGKVLSTSKLRIQMDKLLIESRKNGNKTSIRKPKEGCTYEELAQTLSNRFD